MVHEKITLLTDMRGSAASYACSTANFLRDEMNIDADISSIEVDNSRPFDNKEPQRVLNKIPKGHCFIFADSSKNPESWKDEIIEVAYYLKRDGRSFSQSVNLVIPYFYYGRQDKEDKDSSRKFAAVNAKRVAQELSQYSDRILVWDLHSTQTRDFFQTRVNHLYTLPALAEYLCEGEGKSILYGAEGSIANFRLASTDVGGLNRVDWLREFIEKRYGINLPPVIPFHKYREGAENVRSSMALGDVKETRLLFVDDIGSSGKTIQTDERTAREVGAKAVYLYVSFGEFTRGFERYSTLEKVLISDALPNKFPGKVSVVSLSKSIAQAVYQVFAQEEITGYAVLK